MAAKRKATVCQACGFPSYNGRACKTCLRYYGGPADNAIAAAALARACRGLTLEGVCDLLSDLSDFIVPDWAPFPSCRPDRLQTVSGQDRGG